MASITYTAPLNTQKYWGNQGVVDLSGPSGTMPDGSIVTEISLEVYCGVGTYNKTQDCSYVITDTWGNSVEIEDSTNTGSSNRITVDISGTPDTQLDWNNLSTIDVDGDNYLTLRGDGTLTLTYITPSLGTPGTPTITQNNDGTFSVSWAAASYSGGQGSINYEFWSHTDGYAVYNAGTSTSCKLKISTYAGYNYQFEYGVRATYSGLETFAPNRTKVTFYYPTISTPVLTVSALTGTECSLSWTAAQLSRTTGTVTYYIYKDGTQVGSTTSLTYAFAADTVKTWGDKAVSFYVIAKGTSLGNTDNGTTLTSGHSNTVSFTYVAPYKTIAYYTSSGWVNCLVYYYTSEGWKLCDPYYYTSSGWKSCSTT